MRTALILSSLGPVLLTLGCVQNPGDTSGSGVSARINISATHGKPPLRVAVNANDSSAEGADITGYQWDFNGEGAATGVSASFTFTSPGRKVVSLTVTDSEGRVGTDRVDVRIEGGPVQAVIGASKTSGAAPLFVQFDGSGSTATDDEIFDYFWDFGDGTNARVAKPAHAYFTGGQFVVTLRVVSGGGVESTATTTINVSGGGVGGSLQFNGSQLATLPASASAALDQLTFEARVNAESEGGVVATFGNPQVQLQVLPASNAIKVRVGADEFSASAFNLAGAWRHVAFSHDANTGGVLYLDGQAVRTVASKGQVAASPVILGGGFRGKLSSVRLWSVVRSAAEIAAGKDSQVVSGPPGLIGNWYLDEGSGQTLANQVAGAADGVLGASTSAESIDPAWSSDTP